MYQLFPTVMLYGYWIITVSYLLPQSNHISNCFCFPIINKSEIEAVTEYDRSLSNSISENFFQKIPKFVLYLQ